MGTVSLFSTIVKELHLAGISDKKSALLISIPTLTGALLRIPFSSWSEMNGGKKPFLLLLILSCFGLIGVSVVMGFSIGSPALLKANYPYLLFFGCLSGCGGAVFSVGATQTSFWFKKDEQGRALATFGGYGNMGPGVFTLILTWAMLPVFGVHKTYILWSSFFIAGTIAYFWLSNNAWYFQLLKMGKSKEESKTIAQKDYSQEIFPSQSIKESLLVSAKEGKTWVLVFTYAFSFGGFLAMTSWLPKYFHFYHDIDSLPIVGLLAAIFALSTSAFRAILGGFLCDKYEGRQLTVVFLSLSCMGFFMLMFTPSLNWLMTCFALTLIATGMGVVNASVFKMVPQFCPQAVGGASGWVGGIGALGGFVFPNLLALFLQYDAHCGFANGFSVFLLWGLVALMLIFCLTRKA